MQDSSQKKKNFSAVEIGIFSVVSLIFLNSVYHLFTDGMIPKNPSTVARTTVAEAVKRTEDTPGFTPYETRCEATGETLETSAAKLRILGPLCGAPLPTHPTRELASVNTGPAAATASDIGLTECKVENATAHYVATVFSDPANRKFSTDFIPLENGTNRIVMRFEYKTGKVYPVELTVIRK